MQARHLRFLFRCLPGSSRLQTAVIYIYKLAASAAAARTPFSDSASPLAITCPHGHKTHGQAIPLIAMPLIVDSVKRDLTAVATGQRLQLQPLTMLYFDAFFNEVGLLMPCQFKGYKLPIPAEVRY